MADKLCKNSLNLFVISGVLAEDLENLTLPGAVKEILDIHLDQIIVPGMCSCVSYYRDPLPVCIGIS